MFLVVLITALTSWLFFRSLVHSTFHKVVALLLSVYFFMSFSIIPTYYFLFKPQSYLLLGDSRLIADDYQNLNQYLLVALVQIVGVIIGLYGHKTFAGLSAPNSREIRSLEVSLGPEFETSLIVLSLLGWLGKLAMLLNIDNFAITLIPFATIGTCWLVSGFRLGKQRKSRITLLLVLAQILYVLLLVPSKFDLYALIVAFLFRLLDRKYRWRKSLISFSIGISILIFPYIQNLKAIYTSEVAKQYLIASGDVRFTELRGYFYAILARFDGFSAIVDARQSGVGSWINLQEFCGRLIYNIVPKIFAYRDTITIGQRWSQEVRANSVPFQNPYVSLASGPGAEGFLIWGFAGSLIFSCIYGLVLRQILKCTHSRNLLALVFPVVFIFISINPLENGLMSLAAVINKSLQTGLTIWFIYAVIRGLSKRNENLKWTIE